MNELIAMVGGLFLPGFSWFLLVLAAWTIPWKGYALWLAARNNHTWWFIALLVVNTVAILEIIYIFGIGRPEMLKREKASE